MMNSRSLSGKENKGKSASWLPLSAFVALSLLLPAGCGMMPPKAELDESTMPTSESIVLNPLDSNPVGASTYGDEPKTPPNQFPHNFGKHTPGALDESTSSSYLLE